MSRTEPAPPWRRALVIGLGRSGQAAARLLLALGVQVRGYDSRPEVAELPRGLVPVLGEPLPPAEAFEEIDLLVLSPGVPPGPSRERAAEHAPQAEIHGELSLALSLIHYGVDPTWAPVPTVLITGTNGKSTVTALTGALLVAGGQRPFVGGNLGVPLCEHLLATRGGDQPWPTALVIECSSYQLETLPALPTAVAMVLNISPDHLDRYDSYEHYARTKGRIFAGLGSNGLALLDADDAWTDRLRPTDVPTRLVGSPGVATLDGSSLRVGEHRYDRNALKIAGGHNARNALFALLAAEHLGVTPADCARGLGEFGGLPHRMVFVRSLRDIEYFNDSKATNVASAVAGLGGMQRPFVLIAGGLSKGDDLMPLRELLADNGRGLVVVGDSADRFAELADGVVPVVRAGLMDDAVAKATALAQPGQAVVLAPACASFDQYKSYAQRGERFTEAVLALP